ncbi:MAG: 50S ribosomal protein L6 [Candidatus Marinamargulisbacteria bacterium]
MSKLARKPIKTDSLDVTYDKNELKIKGKLGELTLTIKNNVSLKVEDNSIEVQCENKAILGLHCALIKNLVEGVTNGYSETLTLKGVGYRAALSGSTLNFNLGYSHPVSFDLPEGIKAEVVNPTEIKISGIDKQLVGQACAEIIKLRPAKKDPYKEKGIKRIQDRIIKKVGKKVK